MITLINCPKCPFQLATVTDLAMHLLHHNQPHIKGESYRGYLFNNKRWNIFDLLKRTESPLSRFSKIIWGPLIPAYTQSEMKLINDSYTNWHKSNQNTCNNKPCWVCLMKKQDYEKAKAAKSKELRIAAMLEKRYGHPVIIKEPKMITDGNIFIGWDNT